MTAELKKGTGQWSLLGKSLRRYWALYLMLALPVAYIVIFAYWPMYGVQIAFRNFSIKKGYWGSEWVGLKHFHNFFNGYYFWMLIRNTLLINLYSLAVGFFLPIVFAMMLNEVGSPRYKKTVQTISYMPYFISTVIVVSMLNQIFSNYGLINNLRVILGAGERISFLSQEGAFRHLYVWSGVWQGMGYSAVIYVAALAKVDVELYEAAKIDGANRLQKIVHIDFPTIVPTMTVLLILRVSGLMNVGFEKVFLMQNAANLNVSRIISTYVYEVGLQGGQYSFSTAVGLFNSVINVILLVAANTIVRAVSENSLW